MAGSNNGQDADTDGSDGIEFDWSKGAASIGLEGSWGPFSGSLDLSIQDFQPISAGGSLGVFKLGGGSHYNFETEDWDAHGNVGFVEGVYDSETGAWEGGIGFPMLVGGASEAMERMPIISLMTY